MILHIAAIECDNVGCDVVYQHSPTGPSSAAQIRRLAVVVGWTFPPRIKQDGTQGDSFSDVCPECSPGWIPVTAPNSWKPWTAGKKVPDATR